MFRGMFRELPMSVEVSESVRFVFGEPLSVMSLHGKRAEQELAEHGPRKPPLASVTYGEVPPGYREEFAPAPLTGGEYQVIAFGEQGTARASFIIGN